uniref:Aspartyl/asparaginy/proline hydroxylase domain-containing protein n=1 Tax=Meloidogyne javanica TaxID=6303 RepID=A0A915LEB0_MELJA
MAGSGSPPRHAPLLRRQTSNLPGQVHHMAVMVAPSRVDYSVNKGGLRSWAKCTAPKEKVEEEKDEEKEEKEREEENEEVNEGEGDKDEVAVNVVEEILSDEKEQQKQVHRRRVKSWRALQTAKSLAEGMRPRKELLKKRHKLHDFVSALEKYQKMLNIDRSSPRALFGRARVYQLMSEFADDGDNRKLLDTAMENFELILLQNKDSEDVPDELFRLSALYYVQCARFRGGSQQLHKILQVQRALILEINPHHSQAQAYFGYILKVYEGDLERGVQLMRRALRDNKEGNVVNDQKFYFHLGDAFTRLGRLKDAHSVYADAVKYGLFPSTLQRSFHNLAKLTARPWWTIEQTECSRQLRQLERHWTTVKEEAQQMWHNHHHLFEKDNYSNNLINEENDGHWILTITDKGNSISEEICGENLMPLTCQMLRESFTDAVRLSVLKSGTSTWPHCGPTNYILEAHLGLVTHSDARLRVENETRGWRQGKMLIFDTSFEHEIIFEGAPANALLSRRLATRHLITRRLETRHLITRRLATRHLITRRLATRHLITRRLAIRHLKT